VSSNFCTALWVHRIITKLWVADALAILAESLSPLPHEINELDWKASLSAHKDRLAEHLMAMANQPNGGVLVFGINNDGVVAGVSSSEVEQTIGTLANLGRGAIEPPLALDHAVVDHSPGIAVLLVKIPNPPSNPRSAAASR